MTAPKTLAEALALLQGQLPRVAKEHTAKITSERTGKSHTYDYADLTDVSSVLLPVLSSLGLSFTSCPTLVDGKFALEYSLRHAVDNETIGGLYPLPTAGSPQDIGKAITYARRYALCAVTGLAPGGDDDDAQAAEQAHHAAVRSPARTARPRNASTDAELDVAGRMTRRQKKDHDRLEADVKRNEPGHRAKTERTRPKEPDPDDPWAQDAPVDHDRAAALRGTVYQRPDGTEIPAPNGRDLTDPEDKPGSVLPAQHRAIERILGLMGIEDRDARHAEVAGIIGAPVESMKDLTYAQAAEALTELNHRWSVQARKVRENAGS